MILYLDSSAIVKRYISEEGSELVASTIEQAKVIGSSLLSKAETISAFAKAVRMNALTDEQGIEIIQTFEQDWAYFVRIEANETIVSNAGNLAWQYHLRAYDAIQLATAIFWREHSRLPIVFVSFDKKLNEVVQALQLPLIS